MNIQEVGKTMRDLAREMEKSGLIDEIVDDAFSSMDVSSHASFSCIARLMCSSEPVVKYTTFLRLEYIDYWIPCKP